MKLADHENEFVSTLENLTEVAIQLPDEISIIILLLSVPKFYDNFMVVIKAKHNLPSLSALKIKLLKEGAR